MFFLCLWGWGGGSLQSPQRTNMISIINISSVFGHFFEKKG